MSTRVTPRELHHLSADELGLVLQKLPDAEEVARSALVSRGFKLAARHAAEARFLAASRLGVPMPTLKEGEPKLRAVRWVEAVAQRVPCTLAAGVDHSLAILTETSNSWIISWGSNDQNQLGRAESDEHFDDDSDDDPGWEVVLWTEYDEPMEPREVSAGAYHSLALDVEGGVWVWGWGDPGILRH